MCSLASAWFANVGFSAYSRISPVIGVWVITAPKDFEWIIRWKMSIWLAHSCHRWPVLTGLGKCPNFSHHPNIGDIISNRYFFKWCSKSLKWDIYQTLFQRRKKSRRNIMLISHWIQPPNWMETNSERSVRHQPILEMNSCMMHALFQYNYPKIIYKYIYMHIMQLYIIIYNYI